MLFSTSSVFAASVGREVASLESCVATLVVVRACVGFLIDGMLNAYFGDIEKLARRNRLRLVPLERCQ